MNSVAVLMSTYNGERFLREQIDSILNQKDVEVRLFIRDDGSSDRTVSIIKEYLERYDNIGFIQGENVGVGNSFMALVREAGTIFDYYAFADQDDIWMPEKISKAIGAIEKKEGPWCYCSNQLLVDADGNVIRQRHEKPIDVSYMQILCNNLVTGCTMVWNRELQMILIRDNDVPSRELLVKRIHDVWVAMVAAVTGHIYYDSVSYIMYRQHENNVVGVKNTGLIREWRKKLAKPELRSGRSALAKETITGFGDLISDSNINDALNKYANYNISIQKKVALMKDSTVVKYSKESKAMYITKVLIGLF